MNRSDFVFLLDCIIVDLLVIVATLGIASWRWRREDTTGRAQRG